MGTKTVNIAFQEGLLREIDEVARMESRSRSDFLREAARAYICRKLRWINIFAMGREIAEREELTAEDVQKEIKAYRKERNRNQ
ncbi:MAG: ribbon-helix-helix protein, CopG family [Candidatus Sabulitectum sp.]|nr:ribbon-helix-helix protein, CopG family [Candidatus Sabulitectum sp.]